MCVTMPRLNISMIWYTHEVKVFVAPIGPVIGTETAFYQINFFFFSFFPFTSSAEFEVGVTSCAK